MLLQVVYVVTTALNVTAGGIRSDHCTVRTISDYFAILPFILTIGTVQYSTVILVSCPAEFGPGFQEPIKETIQAMFMYVYICICGKEISITNFECV